MENDNKGLVYFLKENGSGAVKIGVSTKKSLSNRISSLSTAMPYGCELIATIETDNSYDLEHMLHEKYKTKRLAGEFFNISSNDVFDCLNKYGNETQNRISSFIYNVIKDKTQEELDILEFFLETEFDIPTQKFFEKYQLFIDVFNGKIKNIDTPIYKFIGVSKRIVNVFIKKYAPNNKFY